MNVLQLIFRAADVQSGTVSRFSSKLKGAIRGAIDGAPLEATEIPTVWDAFTDEPQVEKFIEFFF